MHTVNSFDIIDTPFTLVNFMEKAVKNFRKEYQSLIEQTAIDIILVDYLNYFGISHGVDIAMTAIDMAEEYDGKETAYFLNYESTKQKIDSSLKRYKEKEIYYLRGYEEIGEKFDKEVVAKVLDDMVIYIKNQLRI